MTHPTVLRIGAPLSGEPHPALQWIEVASSLQIPSFQIIGLPSPEVAEARERVRAAIEFSGLDFPRRRVVLNLSPASIRKRGTGVDLAMALAILHDSYGVQKLKYGTLVAWGELGLNGFIKPTGQLTRAIYAAWESSADILIVARGEYPEARLRLRLLERSKILAGTPPVIAPAETLLEAWEILRAQARWKLGDIDAKGDIGETIPSDPDRKEMGHTLLPLPRSMERVIGVAAAGAHHLMLLGPRGTGKSHALEWLVALQPPLSAEMQVRHALLEELSGGSRTESSETRLPNPVRRISSHARPAALLGGAGGNIVRPGEFSLAHGGLLIADEFPEWARDSREALREPLERGTVTLTRAQRAIELPARFTLAANGNLCPCGGWPPQLPIPIETEGRRYARCHCTQGARVGYLARLSGPILDRLDILMMVAGIEPPENYESRLPALRIQTQEAQARAIVAWGAPAGQLGAHELENILASQPKWQEHMNTQHFSSLRTRHKILRVALTLSAWDGEKEPSNAHFLEAACYRPERYGLLQP